MVETQEAEVSQQEVEVIRNEIAKQQAQLDAERKRAEAERKRELQERLHLEQAQGLRRIQGWPLNNDWIKLALEDAKFRVEGGFTFGTVAKCRLITDDDVREVKALPEVRPEGTKVHVQLVNSGPTVYSWAPTSLSSRPACRTPGRRYSQRSPCPRRPWRRRPWRSFRRSLRRWSLGACGGACGGAGGKKVCDGLHGGLHSGGGGGGGGGGRGSGGSAGAPRDAQERGGWRWRRGRWSSTGRTWQSSRPGSRTGPWRAAGCAAARTGGPTSSTPSTPTPASSWRPNPRNPSRRTK